MREEVKDDERWVREEERRGGYREEGGQHAGGETEGRREDRWPSCSKGENAGVRIVPFKGPCESAPFPPIQPFQRGGR